MPSFNFGGWYDLFREGPVDNFVGLRKSGGSEAARKGQRLLMGPWTHNSPLITTAGQVNFGRVSAVDIDELQLLWFDYWLKETDSGIMDSPPVRLFTMGKNVWQDEEDWPLPQTQYVPLYLHSDGRANSLSGDGLLSWREPVNELPDYYLYNPLNPVPTIGAGGSYDQSPVETRQDVLVYSTESLSEEIEITGSVTAHLFVSSSAPDTDFVVKIVDVSPNGFARNIAEGILRTRYRTSFMSSSSLRPGSVHSLTVDLGPTSNVFQKGHRIRVEITSSHFPRFDRNTNTGTPVALEGRCIPALQTIYHDKEYPSHIVLPVIMRHSQR